MQRITISVSDEVAEWLAERAKATDRSLSYVAWHGLQTAMLLTDSKGVLPERERRIIERPEAPAPRPVGDRSIKTDFKR